jgi:hypothetical protein
MVRPSAALVWRVTGLRVSTFHVTLTIAARDGAYSVSTRSHGSCGGLENKALQFEEEG